MSVSHRQIACEGGLEITYTYSVSRGVRQEDRYEQDEKTVGTTKNSGS